MKTNFDQDLLSYFTDVEHLRALFKESVAAPTLIKRLLVIHGVGGVGKSSLLRMFRLHCKSVSVPVALASGDEAKSVLDVLARWTDDFKADGAIFPTFRKTFAHYRTIQAKVDEQAKKAQDAAGRIAEIAGKAASKTAEVAGGALAGVAIGSVIPGIGTAIGGALGGVLGGMGAEALVDWLRGFLKQPDIDLLLDPTKRLTDDFLTDITRTAEKQRIVLMLDTFEQMTALEDWAHDVAQRLHVNTLFVIAGRAIPDWDRAWSGWIAHAQVEELKPMSEEVMRELVRRYYATMRGGEPDPKQVEAIILFARGLPMVVTSAVQLWVKYGVEDFQAVKPEIVANLVDRLMEGVPKELIPALEVAAVVRWFDQPILRAVTGLADVREVYNELRRFPFVRTRAEGLALHDAVREIMDENLRVQDAERHCELHERSATYFEKRLEKATGEEAERLGLERLYHRIRADEEEGIKLFQKMAEELVRYRLVNRLRAMLKDANTYPLERENGKLWREYYNARLAHLETRLSDAEKIYRAIGENKGVEPKLRAYALCDWGQICARSERMSQIGGVEKALGILNLSQSLVPHLDSKLVSVFSHLRSVSNFKCEWEKSIELLEKQRLFFQENGDSYGVLHTLSLLRSIYGMVGSWAKAFDTVQYGIQMLKMMPTSPFLESRLVANGPWHLIWSGRYAEAEQAVKKGMIIAQEIDDADYLPGWFKDLGMSLGLQGKFTEAHECFAQSVTKYEQLGNEYVVAKASCLGFMGATLLKQGIPDRAKEYLIQSLSIKQKFQDNIGISELLNWFGELYELRDNQVSEVDKLIKAESYYRQSLDYRWTGRRYFECAALTGLVRVKHTQGDLAAIPPLLADAEQLALQYEYNDHLASLRLTQGHIAWEGLGQVSNLSYGIDAAKSYYQHALIYALRYNRFLLDEVLSGRQQGTPLRPIIPHCLERGEEGRKMLIALRDWWKTGINDIGSPRPDTISPIHEGIPLLDAEHIAREREPGDGSTQKSVIEQIEAALSSQKVG